MADPFVGEIRAFGFNFAPTGWAICSGQLLPISQNTALFSILGTTYGGNGTTNFALPNLTGSTPMHFGNGVGLTPRSLGEQAGSQTVTLLTSEMPQHQHQVPSTNAVGDQYGPAPGYVPAQDAGGNNLFGSPANANMSPSSLQSTGGSLPHNNLQPYLVLTYCIALQGVYPPRS